MTDVPPINGQSFGAALPPSTTSTTGPGFDQESANSWKLRFQGALATENYPEKLNEELVRGVRERAWTELTDESNHKFKTFTSFCEAPEPFGLGTPYQVVNEFLVGLMGKRAVRRLTAPEPNQGARTDLLPAPRGKKLTRHEVRLLTINHADPVVRQLRDAGHLSAKQAEPFGVAAKRLKKVTEGSGAKPDATADAISNFCVKYSDLAKGTTRADEATLAELKADVAEIFPPPAYSVIEKGTNAQAFAEILRLHVPRGSRVADVTYGRGAFWREVESGTYDVRASDLVYTGTDCRATEYSDGEMDALVLDPPYLHTPGGNSEMATSLEESYRTRSRDNHGHASVIRLYVDGAREAARVVRAGGVLVIKCMDEIEASKNRWSHIEIKTEVEALGFEAIDLFLVLRTDRPPPANHAAKRQYHARKVHSYFWVFRRSTPEMARKVTITLKLKPTVIEKLQIAADEAQLTLDEYVRHLSMDAVEGTPVPPATAMAPGPGIKKPSDVAATLRSGLRQNGFSATEAMSAVNHLRTRIKAGEQLASLLLDAIQFLTPPKAATS